jgi:hypothetical protein
MADEKRNNVQDEVVFEEEKKDKRNFLQKAGDAIEAWTNKHPRITKGLKIGGSSLALGALTVVSYTKGKDAGLLEARRNNDSDDQGYLIDNSDPYVSNENAYVPPVEQESFDQPTFETNDTEATE